MRTLRVKTSAILALLTALLVAPSAMHGQTSDPIPASASVREEYGVTSYRLHEAEAFYTLEALADDTVVMAVHWSGSPATKDVSVSVLKDGSSLDITCSEVDGSSDCRAYENSESRAVQDLSDVSRALVSELGDYMGDVFGNAVADGCTAKAAMPTLAKGSRLPFEGPAAKQLNDRQKRVMNGICYIAGVCTGFWPIGTLICGPTAVGCAVYYFTAS